MPTLAMTAPTLILFYNTHWDEPLEFAGQAVPAGCEVTSDRDRIAQADAVVFHIPTLAGLPRPHKRPGQLWVAWSMECEVHYPEPRREAPGPFDLFVNYREDADFHAPYYGPELLGPLRRMPTAKTAEAPIACFISADIDRSGRSDYLRELMRHVPVHSYGKLLRNRTLSRDDGHVSKIETISRYKFTLAFENARGTDYVTEKLYDPLIAGSVPVYLGAPNVDAYAPADGCYINVDDYADPQDLARHLIALDHDAGAYARYLHWKHAPLRQQFVQRVADQQVKPLIRLFSHLRALATEEGVRHAGEPGLAARREAA